MQKHAYLILAHGHLGQLKKLITLLDDRRNSIFIHMDAKTKGFRKEDFDGICKFSSLSFIEPAIRVKWGGVSIMRAELALLSAAKDSGCRYFHLLSGMDLPIKSQDEIHSFFEEHDGKEFIQLWTMKKSTYTRFSYFTPFPEGAGFFVTNYINNLAKGIQMLLGIRINKDIDFHFGSQWFSITDELAGYILDRKELLEKVFRHTNTCDEIFIPTLVCNSGFMDRLFIPEEATANSISTANMRFIDWSRGKSIRHPWTFVNDDYGMLMDIPHLFARKFDDSVDAVIIDRICDKLR